MKSLAVLAALPFLFAPPVQEPTKAREELVRSLEERFAAIPFFSVRFSLQDEDDQGKSAVSQQGRLWYWSDRPRLYAEIQDLKREGGPAEMSMLSGGDWMFVSMPEGAKLMTGHDFFGQMFRRDHEEIARLDAIIGVPSKHATFDALVASLKSILTFELAPDPSDTGKASLSFRVGYGSARSSWFKETLEAPEGAVAVTADEVTFDSGPRKKTVIDRTTGFLKSIRLELEDGGAKALRFERLEKAPAIPDIRIPEKVEAIRMFPPGFLVSKYVVGLMAVGELRKRLVRDWDKAGTPERAEAISDYFAGLYARMVAGVREATHRKVATEVVGQWMAKGRTLQEIATSGADAVAALKGEIERIEGSGVEDLVQKGSENARKNFDESFREAPAPIASQLADRVAKAFEAERIKKALTTYGPPDAATILREELEERRALAVATHVLAVEVRELQGRRMAEAMAAAGAYSFKVTLESSVQKSVNELDVDVRPAEGYVSFGRYRAQDGRRTLVQAAVHDADGSTLKWGSGTEGERADRGKCHEAFVRQSWDWEVELAHLRRRLPPAENVEAFRKSFRPRLELDMIPPGKDEKFSDLKWGASWRPEGGASWLDDFEKAATIEFREEGRSVTFGGNRWSSTVELATGFLRSMRNELPDGGFVTMTISEVKSGTPGPDLSRPGKVRTIAIPAEAIAIESARLLTESLDRESRALLRDWERGGFAARPAAVRRFYTRGAAWLRVLVLDATRVKGAVEFVRGKVRTGVSLDTLESEADARAAELEALQKKVEGEFEGVLAESDGKLEKRLVEHIGKAPAPIEARKVLRKLVEEAIEPDLVKAALPERPPPDFKLILRAAIEAVRKTTR